MLIDRRAIVLSFAGGTTYSPRGQRARVLAGALEADAGYSVQRIPAAGRAYSVQDGDWPDATVARRMWLRLARPFVLDECEPAARRSLRGWKPDADGAVLVGWPFSPLYQAARRLRAATVPYVVDIGDPWILTAKDKAATWGRAFGRTPRAETFLWEHAAGAVVTTVGQEGALHKLFGELPILCRPNGYEEVDRAALGSRRRSGPGSDLRLVQFGSVYEVRLPIAGWLSRLRAESGVERLTFVNYGPVNPPELLATDDPRVEIEVREPVAWTGACSAALDFDAAVVVGNHDPAQLPSKAIQYLTLPIPRLALTVGGAADELGRFASSKPGFLGVTLDADDGPALALAHLRRAWSPQELGSPAGDAWPAVARELVDFATECWDAARNREGVAAEPGATGGSDVTFD